MFPYITHKGDQCEAFFRDYISADRKILLIATLGFNDLCLFFPRLLSQYPNVDYLFLVEERPEVAEVLRQAADRNRSVLVSALAGRKVQFESVAIVADDTANVAGRRATRVCAPWLANGYTDVMVDASSMSRGVCFPVFKHAYLCARRTGGAHAHLLTAGRATSTINAVSMSSDAPQYMHGFQSDMDTDEVQRAVKLWIPQLSERAVVSLERIHRELMPEETCPILPFPAANPRRGDLLLREFEEPILNDWDVNLKDVIYAHESDPTDVCESIVRINNGRREAFSASPEFPPRTVLSPAGSRIGSVGMLLAALRLDLPIMYEESIGYNSDMLAVPALQVLPPDYLWHIWPSP
ncbi:hypothetical protein [Paraburkholderia caribensis]|uniref:hypothetical protein n=1 Tax=Paraburkholderia caribensis TaxID=75105 RepID=UPI00078D0803|nr:hypothetical protein [Paraburkholderia caribensis]AMV44337.1 hypothetical protein ATN79_20555 [Paraburkholderia caribensis]